MNDADFSKLDTHLHDLVTNHFQIDLTVEKNLDTYHVFRNDVVELIDDEDIGKVKIPDTQTNTFNIDALEKLAINYDLLLSDNLINFANDVADLKKNKDSIAVQLTRIADALENKTERRIIWN